MPASVTLPTSSTTQMTFDAQPIPQDTALPMTFDAQPAARPITVPSPASTSTTTTQPGSAQPPGAAPYYAPSIAAAPQPHGLAAHLEQWAGDVQRDLMDGGRRTSLGALLHKLRAPGLQTGVNPEAAQFMGSLPLGATKTVQGAAEIAQPRQRVQGLEDMGSGALQAATIPASIVAPEAGEASAAGIDAAAGQAARASGAVAKSVADTAGKVAHVFDPHTVQAPLQTALRDTLATVANEAGVEVKPGQSIRDMVGHVADAVLAKSRGLYGQLDGATQGQFQRFDNALTNINRAIRETTGLDDVEEERLLTRKQEVEEARQLAFARAKRAGVDPKLIDEADAHYRQGQALHDLSHAVRMTATGMRPELAAPGSIPEALEIPKLFTRLSRLYDSTRLGQAIGSERAGSLLRAVDEAFVQQHRIADRVKLAKTVGKVTGTGAAVGAVGAAGKAAKDALGGP